MVLLRTKAQREKALGKSTGIFSINLSEKSISLIYYSPAALSEKNRGRYASVSKMVNIKIFSSYLQGFSSTGSGMFFFFCGLEL